VVRAVIALVGTEAVRQRLRPWQVLHQCGTVDRTPIAAAYTEAGLEARVVDYLDTMGLAWRGAELAISRAGAGSVAEAWANATPTVFLPNPYHADQHQRHNAEPLAAAGGARIVADEIDPARNVAVLTPVLGELIDDPSRRQAMRRAAQESCPPDGATAVAQWVAALAANGSSRAASGS
jgi:UDP-N-acetylglucosamine--N-acetylmuramyl-(pentapeptide) pyrophosphoryl-undecaprenol N-acetylglucosamine transferase